MIGRTSAAKIRFAILLRDVGVAEKMKLNIAFILSMSLASATFATEPPGYDKTEAVLPKTTHAIVAEIISCSITNKCLTPKPH